MPHAGGPEVLQTLRRRAPRPAAGEVVVRVEATGVSFAEVQMLRGRYFNQPRFPFVPGYDLVGTVVEAGAGAEQAWLGRR
ncbi:MAG: alcohol dehydrogenase catalytic domain-containing protein, partial [Chloroflexota bacterium]|nr:alcohol dehydrogenase catalytic domain-containing protein [Chloroflexota bacterium]